MIGPRAGTRVWLAAGLTDMRCGIDSTAVNVQTVLAEDPYACHVFAFRGRRGDLVKLLWSSSEQLEHAQLELIGGMVAGPAAEPASNVTSIEAGRKKRTAKPRPGLREFPEHLPRRTVVHAPPLGHDGGCDCQACGRALREIDQDVSEVLDYEPGSFHVVRHARPRLACAGCKTITQAAAPSRPVERGMAGPGLLAHVLVGCWPSTPRVTRIGRHH